MDTLYSECGVGPAVLQRSLPSLVAVCFCDIHRGPKIGAQEMSQQCGSAAALILQMGLHRKSIRLLR